MKYIKFHSLKAIQRGMLTGKPPRPSYVPVPAPRVAQPSPPTNKADDTTKAV